MWINYVNTGDTSYIKTRNITIVQDAICIIDKVGDMYYTSNPLYVSLFLGGTTFKKIQTGRLSIRSALVRFLGWLQLKLIARG